MKKPRVNQITADDLLGIPDLDDIMADVRPDLVEHDNEETKDEDKKENSRKETKASNSTKVAGQQKGKNTISVDEPVPEIQSRNEVTKPTKPPNPSRSKPATVPPSLQRFMDNVAVYEKGWANRKLINFRIDADLALTIRSLDIRGLRTTRLINSMLRTFIEEHADELRQFRKPGKSLL